MVNDQLHWTGELSLENNGGFAQFFGNIGRGFTGYNAVRFSGRTTDPSRTFYATYARDMRNGVMFQVEPGLSFFYQNFFSMRFHSKVNSNHSK